MAQVTADEQTYVVTEIRFSLGEACPMEAWGYVVEEGEEPSVTHTPDRRMGAKIGDTISTVERHDPPTRRLAYQDSLGRWCLDHGDLYWRPISEELHDAIDKAMLGIYC
jgi:hypothetical protein